MEDKRPARYEDLACRIAELIRSGSYKPGDRLPSIRELAATFCVSVNTVREAYALLEKDRFVEAVSYRGYFVADREHVAPPTVPNPASMNPELFSLCSIYSTLRKYSPETEDAGGLAIATASSRLWPVERLQKHAVDAVRLHPDVAFDYQMSPGYEPLREQIAILGLSSKTRMSADRVIVTSGCQESIYLALAATVAPGETVAVETPVYFNLLDMLSQFRAKVLEIPCAGEGGMHLETLEFALDHHRVSAVLTIANFNNPTGSVMSDERKERLVGMLSRRGIPLIEDDIYGDIHYGGAEGADRPRTCKSFDRDGTVLYCSSLSKTLSPGLRVGWIEAGRWHDQAERLKTLVNLGASSLSQVTAALFLQEGSFPRHVRRLRAIVGENMDALRRSVREYFPEGTTMTDPSGGFVLWVSLPRGASSMELYRRALERNVLIAPGRVFSLEDRYNSSLRLNAGVWESSTDGKIRLLGSLAREIAEETPSRGTAPTELPPRPSPLARAPRPDNAPESDVLRVPSYE